MRAPVACAGVAVVQRTAAFSPEANLLKPTICPRLLMARAWLEELPGRVPRSVIAPFCQKNASNAEAVLLQPTTCPKSLTPMATLATAPGGVPKPVTAHFRHR